MHLKEGKPKTIQELGEKAENYVKAHATDIVFGIDSKPTNIRSLRPETRQCHNCGEMGHLRSRYPEPSSPRNVKDNSNTSASPQNAPRRRRTRLDSDDKPSSGGQVTRGSRGHRDQGHQGSMDNHHSS